MCVCVRTGRCPTWDWPPLDSPDLTDPARVLLLVAAGAAVECLEVACRFAKQRPAGQACPLQRRAALGANCSAEEGVKEGVLHAVALGLVN